MFAHPNLLPTKKNEISNPEKKKEKCSLQKRGGELYHATNDISWTAALRPLLPCLKIAIYTNMLKDKRHFKALLTNFKTVGASRED